MFRCVVTSESTMLHVVYEWTCPADTHCMQSVQRQTKETDRQRVQIELFTRTTVTNEHVILKLPTQCLRLVHRNFACTWSECLHGEMPINFLVAAQNLSSTSHPPQVPPIMISWMNPSTCILCTSRLFLSLSLTLALVNHFDQYSGLATNHN